MFRAHRAAVALALVIARAAEGSSAAAAPRYDPEGVVVSRIPPCGGFAFQATGRFVVTILDGFGGDLSLRRYTAAGRREHAPGAKRATENVVHDVGPFGITVGFQPDGKTLVAASTNDWQRVVVARYDTRGLLDDGFGEGGVVTLDAPASGVNAVAARPDGTIVVVDAALVLHRLDTSGGVLQTVDASTMIPSGVSAAAFAPDGATFVAGVDGWGIDVERRFPDLSVDSTFGGGLVFVPVADSPAAPLLTLLPLPDGGVLVGYVDLDGRPYVARVAASGDVGQTAALQVWPAHLALQPDGSILVAGSFRQSFSTAGAPSVLARFDMNLSPDVRFGRNGIVPLPVHSGVLAVATTVHQRIVVGLAKHHACILARVRE